MNHQEDQLHLLRSMLSEHEKQLEEATAVARREQPIVASLKAAIAALSGQTEFLQTESRNSLFHISRIAGLAQPDPNVPSRKDDYAQMTIIASLRLALEKRPGEFVHADDLVREIYEPIPHKDVFYRIKRTIVSELLRGMDKSLFVRGTKPNTFGLKLEKHATAEIANGDKRRLRAQMPAQ